MNPRRALALCRGLRCVFLPGFSMMVDRTCQVPAPQAIAWTLDLSGWASQPFTVFRRTETEAREALIEYLVETEYGLDRKTASLFVSRVNAYPAKVVW